MRATAAPEEGNKVRLSRKALIKEAREKQQKAASSGASVTSSDAGAGHDRSSTAE
jgi:hypothetical protein